MDIGLWLSTYWVFILVGAALSFLPYTKKISAYYSTLIHEVGHGISSLNPVGGLGGISISPDSSGENRVSYRGGLLFIPIRIGSLMAGYAAPIYAGILFIATVMFDLGDIFRWVMLIICGFTLLAIRNMFGALIILLHAAFWVVTALFSLIPLYPVLMVLGTVLLCRGFADYFQVAKYSFMPSYKGLGTDFDLLQQEFFLPRQVWFVLFTIGHGIIGTFLLAIIISFSAVNS